MVQRAKDECDRTAARGVKRRIKTQTVLPSAETVAMLFWALLASQPDQHAQSGQLADVCHDDN
jgi:hypothetical protein